MGGFLGAWFGFYVWWVHGIPFVGVIEGNDLWLSPAIIVIIGAAMTFTSLFWSPEAKDMELSEIADEVPTTLIAKTV